MTTSGPRGETALEPNLIYIYIHTLFSAIYMDYDHIIHVVEKKWVFVGLVRPTFGGFYISPFIIGFWAHFATKQNACFG